MAGFRRRYTFIKRFLDLGGGLAGTVLLGIVFIPVSLAIKLTSPGPVFFRQTRLTKGEKAFSFLKFRTMAMGQTLTAAERDRINEMGGPHFKSRLDPRITPVGRFLRKFSLDELPQVLNVLQGHMSLVGPRPPLRHEVEQYTDREKKRLTVKTGITGLWQIRGRSHIPFSEMVDLDLEYIEMAGLLTDVKILLQTIPAVITCRGAW